MPRGLSSYRLESWLIVCVAVGIWTAWSGIGRLARAEWSAIAQQRVSYTTDAFQFSSARRLALSADPSLPTAIELGDLAIKRFGFITSVQGACYSCDDKTASPLPSG
jgi:hypothetical protein